MAIIIDHGTSLPGMQGAVQSLVEIIQQNRARKDRKDRQDKEDARQADLDKRNDTLLRESSSRANAAEQRAQEDQAFQREDRARAAGARKDIGRAQDAEFQGYAGVRTENDPKNLGSITTSPATPPNQIQVPRGLPRELWPEYVQTHAQLEQTEDPAARHAIISQKKQDWSRFAALKGVDELSRTMSHDIDTGALQADPESAPDPREQEILDQIGEQQRQLGEFRKGISQDGSKFDPTQIDNVRKKYTDLKTKLADIHASKQIRNSAVADIEEMAVQWQGSREMQGKFAHVLARVRTNVLSPKEGIEAAEKIVKEPELYGEGQPFANAPSQVKRQIHKEALTLMHETFQGDDWKRMTPAEKTRELSGGLPHFVQIVAQQYDWDPNAAAVDQGEVPYDNGPQDQNMLHGLEDGSAQPGASAAPAAGAQQKPSLEQLTQQYTQAGLPPNIAPYFAKASAEGATAAQIGEMLANYKDHGSPMPVQGKKKLGGKKPFLDELGMSQQSDAPADDGEDRERPPAKKL